MSPNRSNVLVRLVVSSSALALFPAAIFAQQTSAATDARRWEIEVHGGFGGSTSPRNGSGELPPREGTFPLPITPRSSLILPSWFIGLGPDVLNTGAGAERMHGIDAALSTVGADWGRGGAFGARFAGHLTPSITAEFSFDYLPGPLQHTSDALAPLRQAEQTFPVAFAALFAREPAAFVNPSASASLTLGDDGGGQVVTTGTLNLNLGSGSIIRPYLTAGGGVVAYRGGTATATLVGQYSFTGLDVFPITQTDTVVVRYRPGDASFAPVFGGGVRVDRGGWGVRADVRALVVKDTRSVSVDAAPVTTPGSPTGFVVGDVVRFISFSTDPGALRSTLSGSLDDVETFGASGRRVQTSITFGVFRRF